MARLPYANYIASSIISSDKLLNLKEFLHRDVDMAAVILSVLLDERDVVLSRPSVDGDVSLQSSLGGESFDL